MDHFWPKHFKQFFTKRLQETIGAAGVAFSLFAILSLVFHQETDPTFFCYSNYKIKNYAGWLGAALADSMLQMFGYGAFFIIFSLMIQWINYTLNKQFKIFHIFYGLILCLLFSQFITTLFPDLSLRYFGILPFMLTFVFKGLIGSIIAMILFVVALGFALNIYVPILSPIFSFICDKIFINSFSNLFKIIRGRRELKKDTAFHEEDWSASIQAETKNLSQSPSQNQSSLQMNLQQRSDLHPDMRPDIQRGTHTDMRPDVRKATRPDIRQELRSEMLPETEYDYNQDRYLEDKEQDPDLHYHLPNISLLAMPKNSRGSDISESYLKEKAMQLERVLAEFGVKGVIENIHPGPVVTRYDLEPAPGIKTSRVISLADDIARSMSVFSARISVVQGRNAIGIELPNKTRNTVYLRSLLESEEFQKTAGKLLLALGEDIVGRPVLVDLSKMPHLLIAGTTGSGKSVGINTMILSLLYKLTPDQCRFVMIDPKMLELSIYNDIPHLLIPVVTEPKKAIAALKWAVKEMETRYANMAKVGVRNIESYNQKIINAQTTGELILQRVQVGFDDESGKPIYENKPMNYKPLPFIVVVVDEMADLMMVAGKEIEACVQRLAQMARAAGIHLIMATQRPSVDVITGTIKANFPTRISFHVTSKIDSRTILGEQGAEQLLGQGDMLYMAGGGKIMRVHGPFVDDDEVAKVVNYLKSRGEADYSQEINLDEEDSDSPQGGDEGEGAVGHEDPMFQKAVELIIREQKVSTSFIQRHLQIGYNRAARIVEDLEKKGIVSAANHVGKREILIS